MAGLNVRRLLRHFGVSVIALLGVAVLAEVVTQVYLKHFAPSEVFRRYASLRDLHESEQGKSFLTPHRYLGYYPTPGWDRPPNRHNSLGYRGREIPRVKSEGEFRIVCLGGSTTYTSSVFDHTRTYPAMLERDLAAAGHPEVRVINAGMHGWTSWESLVNLEFRVLDLEPDLVIVYHGINDLKCRFVWPTKYYLPDNTGSKQNATSLLMPPIWEHSALVRVLLIRAGAMEPHAFLERTLDLPALSDVWATFRRQAMGNSYPSGMFTKVGAEEILRRNPPIYYERNLRNLVYVAQQNGVGVVLSTFAWEPGIMDKDPEAHRIVVDALEEMNGVVRAVAERTGARLFDFAQVFGSEEGLFFDDVHVTEKGAARKGKLFAEFVEHEILASH